MAEAGKRGPSSRGEGGGGGAAEEAKRHRATLDDTAEEFICPLTMELPLDPVMAEDGRTYERSEIQRLIGLRRRSADGTLRSPVTNEPMGPRLLPAVQVRNAIEKLVRSGAIAGDKAERWRRRIEEEAEVAETRRRAEAGGGDSPDGFVGGGDPEAMHRLGSWYYQGAKGLPKDSSMAYHWYSRAADGGSIRGMAVVGSFLVIGVGVERNESEGMVLLGMGAQGGSDYAAYHLGKWYDEGSHGLPKNPEKAKFFLDRVVHGKCGVRHLMETFYVKAADRLRKINAGDARAPSIVVVEENEQDENTTMI